MKGKISKLKVKSCSTEEEWAKVGDDASNNAVLLEKELGNLFKKASKTMPVTIFLTLLLRLNITIRYLACDCYDSLDNPNIVLDDDFAEALVAYLSSYCNDLSEQCNYDQVKLKQILDNIKKEVFVL